MSAPVRPTVGASMVPALLGLSPWQTPTDAWLVLTGRAPGPSETPAMLRGTLLEPGLREWHAASAGVQIHRGPTLAEPGWHVSEHIHARPDGWWNFAESFKAVAVEIKTAERPDGWECGVPAWYLPQVLTQLAARHPEGREIVGNDVVFYHVGGKGPVVYHVERDERRQAALVDWVERWYVKHVLGDTPPEETNEARALLALFSKSTGVWVDPSPEDVESVVEYRRLKAAEKKIKGDLATLKTQLGARIGDADGVAGLLAWDRVKGKTSIDTKRLKKDHPAVFAAYTKTGTPSRKFRDLSATEDDDDAE